MCAREARVAEARAAVRSRVGAPGAAGALRIAGYSSVRGLVSSGLGPPSLVPHACGMAGVVVFYSIALCGALLLLRVVFYGVALRGALLRVLAVHG